MSPNDFESLKHLNLNRKCQNKVGQKNTFFLKRFKKISFSKRISSILNRKRKFLNNVHQKEQKVIRYLERKETNKNVSTIRKINM